MISRIARGAFVALLLVLALLPIVQMTSRAVRELPVTENRRLAPPPSLSDPVAAPRMANAWFADHFGLRSFLIRAKAQVDWSVFGMSDRVHVGRDGYLFYRGTLDLEKPAVERRLATDMPIVLDSLRRFTAALREAGVDTVIVHNLLGDRFLPENVPAAAVPIPPNPRVDMLAAALRTLPDATFVDSTEILRRTMRERAIFHRTDFHWNDPAAFPVAEAAVALMSRAEGRPATVWRHPLEVVERPFSGGVASFMPLFVPPSERGLFVRENWTSPPGFRPSVTEPPYEFVSRTEPGAPDLLRPVLFVGDSFMDAMMRSGIYLYFAETHRLRWTPTLKVSDIAAALPVNARWMLLQFIEVNYMSMEAFSNAADVTRAVEILRARPRPGG